MKRDGHTHSSFCLHGSGEDTELFILKAIEEGFTTYSITEHFPLPPKLLQSMPYSRAFKDSRELRENDLDGYFREMERLKKKYRDRLEILCGVELDYLAGYEDYTRDLLKEYGPYLEDGLLSVHLIPGNGGLRCVDHEPADFQEGLIDYYGSYHKAQQAYYRTVLEAAQADLGPYKPKRIGHLCLCNKFQLALNPTGEESEETSKLVQELLIYLGQNGFSLDVNVAGLFRKHCGQIYLLPWMVRMAKELRIPLIYGSDSHSVADIGRAYDEYEKLLASE